MFSRWPEVAVVSSTAFNKLQPSLERIWALHGKPDIITMIMFPHMTAESGGNMPSRSGSLGSHAVHASSPTSAGLFPLTGMELNGYHDLVPQTRPALLLTLPLGITTLQSSTFQLLLQPCWVLMKSSRVLLPRLLRCSDLLACSLVMIIFSQVSLPCRQGQAMVASMQSHSTALQPILVASL